MSAERKARAPNLNRTRRSDITILIRSSEHPLTWAGIIGALKAKFGVEYTRQALASHRCIVAAYEERRTREAGAPAGNGPSAAARRRTEEIRTRADECAMLRSELDALHGQMMRWAYNAFAHGLDEAILNKDLPGRMGSAEGPVKRRKARQWRQSQARGQTLLSRSGGAKP